MTIYAIAYVVIALAVTLVILENPKDQSDAWKELAASAILGILWPSLVIAILIRRFFKA